MSIVGRYRVVLVALFLTTACAAPPDKEIQQAQAAVDAAREAGAPEYAPAEFQAAEDALRRAHDAVGQRDYRLALSNALDSRERAQEAVTAAATQKAAARKAAEQAVADADRALERARATLKSAEA